MPPSYSMMLPGRMSTPLIFMIAYLLRLKKEPPRADPQFGGSLPASLFSGKQRIRIDRRAVPPALARRHRIDGEMQVRAVRTRVPGMAHERDHLPALDILAFMQTGRIALQMRIIIHP